MFHLTEKVTKYNLPKTWSKNERVKSEILPSRDQKIIITVYLLHFLDNNIMITKDLSPSTVPSFFFFLK